MKNDNIHAWPRDKQNKLCGEASVYNRDLY